LFFFTNSGSEANDLALRLARHFTHAKDILCLESAYHGNLTSTIEISPYKYEGKGGFRQKDYVHKVLAPDGYRGPYKKIDDSNYVEKYVENVNKTIEIAHKKGRKIAAFICESILGCAGQIVLPPNYLASVLPTLKANNILYLADEVQTGFGRAGTHFWAFQTQGTNIIPDIITLGKPMGNGFPLGGVITTKEIADSFHNGMEYFNTFGGNPVSCLVGLTVLDIIKEENLQKNALLVGDYLLQQLRALQSKYSHVIGEVRGLGLFIGIELVKDSKTLEPAAKLASIVAEKLRHFETIHPVSKQKISGILISTDGPYHNVLKLKPPIIFSKVDADMLVQGLDQVLHSSTQRSLL